MADATPRGRRLFVLDDLSVCRQASSSLLSLRPTVRLLVSALGTARCAVVWTTLSLVSERTTATGSMLGVCSFLVQ